MNESQEREFELKLSKAMRRVHAPDDLAKFLMAATEVQAERHLPRSERKHRWAFFVPRPQAAAWMAGALAAVVVVGVFAGDHAYRQHERSVQATQQFETATRITDQALEHTREQLARAGISLDQ
jgi:hypothetical protein